MIAMLEAAINGSQEHLNMAKYLVLGLKGSLEYPGTP